MTRPSQINGSRPSPLAIHRNSRQIHGGAAQSRRRDPPVIIYTHSPKIIHTKPRDFMALVQELTGMARPAAVDPPELDVADDKSGGGCESGPATTRVINSIFGDFPLFTPNSAADFFCSPWRGYGFSGGASVHTLSPSVMEFVKGLPEY